MVNRLPGGLIALFGPGGRQNRHKGLTERAFGKQPPEQIGNAKGHIEGVGQGAGAKHRRHQQLAHQTRDPGGQGENRHNRG